jgi:hypothetical protein
MHYVRTNRITKLPLFVILSSVCKTQLCSESNLKLYRTYFEIALYAINI